MLDAFLHAGALPSRALEDLRFFGVRGALVPMDAAAVPAGGGVRRGWDGVVAMVRRLRRAGFDAHAALGVPPGRIPVRGLESLLQELPAALGRPEVAALGAVGIAGEDRELEERVLARQLELARELRRPTVAAVPLRGRERLTRRLLAALREADLPPERVLVVGVDERTVKAVRSCGHLAGLALSGGGAAPVDAIDAAVRIVAAHGPQGLVLVSDAGLSGGDLLALPRAADRLAKAGLAAAVIRRVCGENAARFLGLEPPGRAASGRSARPASRAAR